MKCIEKNECILYSMCSMHIIYSKNSLFQSFWFRFNQSEKLKKLVQVTKGRSEKQVRIFNGKYLLITLPFPQPLMSTAYPLFFAMTEDFF